MFGELSLQAVHPTPWEHLSAFVWTVNTSCHNLLMTALTHTQKHYHSWRWENLQVHPEEHNTTPGTGTETALP